MYLRILSWRHTKCKKLFFVLLKQFFYIVHFVTPILITGSNIIYVKILEKSQLYPFLYIFSRCKYCNCDEMNYDSERDNCMYVNAQTLTIKKVSF